MVLLQLNFFHVYCELNDDDMYEDIVHCTISQKWVSLVDVILDYSNNKGKMFKYDSDNLDPPFHKKRLGHD